MRRERSFWVYILASRVGGTLYIGVTSDLVRRVYEHREELSRASRVNTAYIDWSTTSSMQRPNLPSAERSG
jgi:predicted GIY-YIG superfamily endonuclease